MFIINCVSHFISDLLRAISNYPKMNQTFNNTRVEPDEELMQCPYDPVHRILPKRMQTHLVKCKRSVLGQPTSPYYQRAKNMVVCKNKVNGQTNVPAC